MDFETTPTVAIASDTRRHTRATQTRYIYEQQMCPLSLGSHMPLDTVPAQWRVMTGPAHTARCAHRPIYPVARTMTDAYT
jgi:hypothetical protein